ncbi:MAG: cyclic pyranopterin monophosphate synthase MoaC [Alphaproteobacteria bacterium]|nr:cyclic pyranopterin monophosphate synthase MoaC [Alphaproteobacteria bacterium]
MSDNLTHLDEAGRARMVDVGEKPATKRRAVACGRVRMSAATFTRASAGDAPKGDVRAVAEIAGVMAGKRTAELIPMCHPLALTRLVVEVRPDPDLPGFRVLATGETVGQTGVEMEALTAASIACLTIYDMLKAIEPAMIVEDIRLVSKSGGARGPYGEANAP